MRALLLFLLLQTITTTTATFPTPTMSAEVAVQLVGAAVPAARGSDQQLLDAHGVAGPAGPPQRVLAQRADAAVVQPPNHEQVDAEILHVPRPVRLRQKSFYLSLVLLFFFSPLSVFAHAIGVRADFLLCFVSCFPASSPYFVCPYSHIWIHIIALSHCFARLDFDHVLGTT